MFIAGFQKVSLLDYPEKVAAVIFTQGCNFYCPYCHNPELNQLVKKNESGLIAEDKILQFIRRRKKLLDAIVITGGEPFLQDDLENFTGEIKKLNLLVKIDTNGSFPEKLKRLIANNWVDYLAMDLKTSWEKYNQLAKKQMLDKVKKSVDILLQGQVDYEFRITVAPKIVAEDDIIKIGSIVKGAKRVFLQQFRNEEVLDKDFEKIKPYEQSTLEKFKKKLKQFVKKVEIRE